MPIDPLPQAQLQLHGWSTKRRVVIVRQRIRGGIARERRVDGKQLWLDLAGPSVHKGDKLWEYAVLVTLPAGVDRAVIPGPGRCGKRL